MIIRSVVLRNFISHENTEIEFPLGVTALVGPNGAGKTSILDAIVYGLFNEKVRGDSLEDLIKRGCRSAEVIVTFEQGGIRFRVRNTRKKKGSDAVLEREGFGILATSATEVYREISKIIEMDKETAIRSIIVRQGEIASLLEENPRDRKNMFGRLLGIEDLERAWNNMRSLIDHFSHLSEDLERLKSEVDLRREDLKRLSNELEVLEKETKQLEEKFEQKSKECVEIEREVEELKKRREKYGELLKELGEVRKEIELKEKELEEKRENLKIAKEAKEKAEKLKNEVEKIPLIEEITRLMENISVKTQILGEKERELNRIQSYKNTLRETEKAYNEYVSLDKTKEKLREKIEGLEKVRDLKVRKEAELNSLVSSLNSDTIEFEKLRDEILRYLPEITIEAKNDELERLKKEKEEIERKISECKEKKGKLDGRRKEISEYLEILGESSVCPVCKSDLTPEHRERVREEFQEEIEKIESELKAIEKNLGEFIAKKREIETRLSEVQRLDVDRALKLQKKLEEYRSGIENLRKELEKLEPKVKDLENAQKELKELENRQKNLKKDYERYITAKQALEREKSEEEVLAEVEKLREEIESHRGECDELIGRLGYLPEEPKKELEMLRKVKEEFDTLNAQASQIEKLESTEKVKKAELERAREKESEILENIRRTDFKEEKLEEAEEKLKRANSEFSGLKAKIDEKKDLKKKREDEVNSLKKLIEERERDLERIQRIANFVKDLETVRAAFSRDGVQKMLRQMAAPEISAHARRYLERFNLDITDIEVTEDFDVSVIKGGEKIPLSSLSGGEKVALAIALRLAIAKAISGRISTIIMDEPTTHLDEDRRRELVEIMRSFLREGASIPQMIIITHHRELEEVADTVYRVEKVNGISRVFEEKY